VRIVENTEKLGELKQPLARTTSASQAELDRRHVVV
jgi:hypothetical protein